MCRCGLRHPFAIFAAAVLTVRLLHTSCGAAGAVDRLLACVSAVAVGHPLAPVVAECLGSKTASSDISLGLKPQVTQDSQ